MSRLLRSLIVVALLALTVSSVTLHAAIAHVTRAQGGGSASASTVTSPATSHTAGNLLVASFTWQAGVNFSSIADTAGNTWTQAGVEVGASGNVYRQYYAYNITGNASNVVTVTLTAGSGYRSIVVHEFSGILTTDPIGGTGSGTGTSTAITTAANITVAAAEEVIVAYMIATPTITAGTGYTLVNFAVTGDATAYFADEYKFVTASEAATATQSTSAAFGIVASSYQTAGGGGGGASPCVIGGGIIGRCGEWTMSLSAYRRFLRPRHLTNRPAAANSNMMAGSGTARPDTVTSTRRPMSSLKGSTKENVGK